MRRRFAMHGAVLMQVTAIAAAGCGAANEPPRVGVSGKVTLGAEPLPTGTITFVPAASGPSATAPISEGTYSIGRSEGPGPGKYRVEIYSVRRTGKQVKDRGNPQEPQAEQRNFVPRRYNTESELKADIKPDLDQVFDYPLDPKEDAKELTRFGKSKSARR
jgi:hypothetical protein